MVHEVLLVARQATAAVGRADEASVQGAVPQAGFHHAALVVLALVAVAYGYHGDDEEHVFCLFVGYLC